LRISRLILLFLSLQFFLYNLGLVGTRTSAFASAVCLVTFVLLSLPDVRSVHKKDLVVCLLGTILAILVIARGSQEMILVFPVLLSSLLPLPLREDHEQGEREVLLLATFLFSLIVFLHFHVPYVWFLIQKWGLALSGLAGDLIGTPYALGPTASGVSSFLLFASFFVATALYAREAGLRYLAKSIPVLLIAQAASLVLLTPLAILIQRREPGWDVLLLNPEIIVFAFLCLSLLVKRPQLLSPSRSSRFLPTIVVGVIALVCSAALTLRPDPGSTGGRILIFNKDELNCRVPVYGMYGGKSGGMFGNLPRFLDGLGYDAETVSELGPESLSGADALIVINVLEYFSDDEKAAIISFVRDGGGLLVLGDHTSISSIRGPFNDLLEPFDIEYLFDSASFMTKGWGEEAVLMPHPVTHGIRSAEEIRIWVGASLGLRPPARPIVVGKYGFSDIGDASAIRMAYLGNRIYDPGEQLGDLVLVAESQYGKGRVLVFGDTSSFQNGALVTSFRFIARIACWLVSGESYGQFRMMVLALVTALLGLFAVVRRDMVLFVVVSVAMLLGSAVGLVPRTVPGEIDLDMPTAIIENSHFERFNQSHWDDDGTGGLQYNLMRAGLYPFLTGVFAQNMIAESELVVIIAPVEPFDAGERDVLNRFMEDGGWILVTCGFEESGGSRRFLADHGLKVLDIPLATYTDTLDGLDVRVHEGWAVEATNPAAAVLADEFDLPYIVKVAVGQGGMILIADTYFFFNENLESMEEFYEGNIEFLRKLLVDIGVAPAVKTDATNTEDQG
jgi:hypothetical protein